MIPAKAEQLGGDLSPPQTGEGHYVSEEGSACKRTGSP
jgi:hypothetical protein